MGKNLKILFIWNVAGVSSILAKWLRKHGHKCTVISRSPQDVFKYLDFYNDISYDLMNFDTVVIDMAKDYDIIHVSSLPRMAAIIKHEYPDKKVILEYHGSDLRVGDADRIELDKFCDKILVSTPDLLPFKPEAIWLPNPVDIEHFKPSEHKEGAIFIKAPYHDLPEVPFIHTVYDRGVKPILYADMPEFFKEYSLYLDIKYYKGFGYLPFHSKTALEALATGMTVYSHERKIIKGLPEEHHPESVIRQLLEIYDSA